MIEARELTRRYGDKTAVRTLSFTIVPGTVTGFPGPNGAGKSATMRLIMGLARPTSGTVKPGGKPYEQHRSPLREVGAPPDAKTVHPGRSARSHLGTLAATQNTETSRVSAVIEMTSLARAATRRVGGFSLGMSPRLGSAAALLGDAPTLILDEPVNGLDPEGVQWVRQLVRDLAAQVHPTFVGGHARGVDQAAVRVLDVVGPGRRHIAVRHDRRPHPGPGHRQMLGVGVIAGGFNSGMLTIAVLGALLITVEYAAGMIGPAFAAVPTRIPVLVSKALTLVVLTAAVTLVSVAQSYFVTMPQLSQYDLVPAPDDPGTCQRVRCPDRPAAARHPQLHQPGLGRGHLRLPTAPHRRA